MSLVFNGDFFVVALFVMLKCKSALKMFFLAKFSAYLSRKMCGLPAISIVSAHSSCPLRMKVVVKMLSVGGDWGICTLGFEKSLREIGRGESWGLMELKCKLDKR